MRIALFGQAAFGNDVLEALRGAGEELVGVSVPRAGARPDPLREAAEGAGLPVIETPALRQPGPFAQYVAWKPDLLVFAFVTDIVRASVLEAAPRGAIQYHPSLLPRHRGPSAMNWAIIAGETRTGLTIFWVDEGIDSGPILLQHEVDIAPDDTLGSLYFQRLRPRGVQALVEAVGLVREGRAPRIEQDHSLATYDPPMGAEHARVDFSRPARVVYNHIRGCDPSPGAVAAVCGKPLMLFGASLTQGTALDEPGTVVGHEGECALVAVIGGTLSIARVQWEGGAQVAAADVLAIGDVLERP